MNYYTNLFYSIYLHSFLLFCFLTIFFWLVISKVEKESINSQMVDSINKSFKNINKSAIEQMFSSDVENYLMQYYQGTDITVQNNNNNLLVFNIAFIVILFIGLILSIFVKYKLCKSKISFTKIIIENIIILILIGIIEYYFFMNIASKYIPVKPSYLPSLINEKINNL